MDEDIFPVLCPKKTYSKPPKKVIRTTSDSNNVEKTPRPSVKAYDPGVPLTTKVAVEYLLNGKLKTSVCRYCLKVTVGLSELDQIMQIAGTGVMYKVSIREMIACFYPFKARKEESFPEKICQRCLDRAINAYLFTQQCEQAERALHNCFDDMNEKFNKLDPVDRPKKRGRQKLNPNYNVLYAEYDKVLDYAEPLRNIINLKTESLSNEPDWNEFECKKCWQVLPDLGSLLNHEQVHPKYMWYNCRLCGKSFVKQNQLKKHFNQVHVRGKDKAEVDKTFRCQECGNKTENYVQHLQHVEKHKFKCIMKHLIEKKTDQLCMVCLKKSMDLVDLDNMVSIHGSCPELVGDKSLYTMLASTLPDPKSYKYQELHVPCEANIMTITERKRKHVEFQKLTNFIPDIGFQLSVPEIVTREKFKTDDFYYYVFCEPQAEDYIINTIDYNIATQDNKSPRMIEITDEEAMDGNLDDKIVIKEGMGFFGKSGFGDIIRGIDKKQAIAIEDSNPEIEMLSDNNEAIVSNVNIEIQVIDRTQNDLHDSNVCGLKLVKKYPVHEMVQVDDKQTIVLADNYNGKDTILKIQEPMNVVGHCIPENNTLFPQARKTDNLADTFFIDEKYSTDLFEQNNFLDKINKPEGSKSSMFYFSNPMAVEITGLTTKHEVLNADKAYIFNFSYPCLVVNESNDQESQTTKLIKESDIPKFDMELIRKISDLSWIFTKTPDKYKLFKNNELSDNITKVIAKPNDNNCKFCWFFKHLNKCEYCKKPIDKDFEITNKGNQKIEKNVVIDNINTIVKQAETGSFFNENEARQIRQMKIDKYARDAKIDKHINATNIQRNAETIPVKIDNDASEPKTERAWQCNICLTNNNQNRSSCHCCESKKYIENGNCKVTFGKIKTFVATHGNKNKEESNIEKGVCISKDITPFIVIDEASMMDTKIGTMQENIGIPINNIKDTNSTQSMDIETEPVNYILNTDVTVNEDMDVEEEPFIPNTVQKFDPTPINTLAANIMPFVGTNIQFHIGSNTIQSEKGARRIKRTRNMPKAFHK